MLARDIQANSLNWRNHPPQQMDVLSRSIDKVGWAGALLYNSRTQRLIDGHARKDLKPDEKVPVLVGDWSEEEEAFILATLDPISALADADTEKLQELAKDLDEDIRQMLEDLYQDDVFDPDVGDLPDLPDGDKETISLTFIVHNSQAEIIKKAIARAKEKGLDSSPLNESEGGNCITAICRAYRG